MIYYNNKPIGFINYEKPYKNLPKLVYSEAAMTEILENATEKDYGKVYRYVGPTTETYTQNAHYTIPASITIIAYFSELGEPSFNVYDGVSNEGILLATLSGTDCTELCTKKVVVDCSTGYLYFEVPSDDGLDCFSFCSSSESHSNNKVTEISKERWPNHCTIKINDITTPVKIEVLTQSPIGVVTVTSNESDYSYNVYDGRADWYVPSEQRWKSTGPLIATLGGNIIEATVPCYSGYLFFENLNPHTEWNGFTITDDMTITGEYDTHNMDYKEIKVVGDGIVNAAVTLDVYSVTITSSESEYAYNVYDGTDNTGTPLATLGGTDGVLSTTVSVMTDYLYFENTNENTSFKDVSSSSNFISVKNISNNSLLIRVEGDGELETFVAAGYAVSINTTASAPSLMICDNKSYYADTLATVGGTEEASTTTVITSTGYLYFDVSDNITLDFSTSSENISIDDLFISVSGPSGGRRTFKEVTVTGDGDITISRDDTTTETGYTLTTS